MEETEFLEHVQSRAHLDTVEGARGVMYASLTALGETTPEAEARDAAAQLPETLADQLTSAAADHEASYTSEEFVDRVQEIESEDGRVDDTDAERHARAALSTFAAAVSSGELGGVRDHLAGDYDDLFDPPELSGSIDGV